MSFDYLAYALPADLIQVLQKQTDSFLNIFYESNYAEEFEEIQEENGEDIDKLGINIAKQIFSYVQDLLEDDEKTLDLDGEYWASPVNFFLTAEFDDDAVLPQPTFTIKKENTRLLVNAIAGTDSFQTEENIVLITSPEKVKEIAQALPNILEEDFKQRWKDITAQTGQYTDAFEEEQDLEEFMADLREFMHEVLIPFYQKTSENNMGIVVMFD